MSKATAATAMLLLAGVTSASQRPHPVLPKGQICRGDGSQNDKLIETARAASQIRVITAVRAQRPDPAGDATLAAQRGDWGLIRAAGMDGSSPAYGIVCAEDQMSRYNQPLTLAYRIVSDVPGSCETPGSNKDCVVDALIEGLSGILCVRSYRWKRKDHRYGNRQGRFGPASGWS
ncbi:hypothetical protein [Sphingomonas sp.]|uniref:hypothetical protein n=1 Tax=Sphingomonas sp. TaxID=28214 RepID=UPI003D6C8766